MFYDYFSQNALPVSGGGFGPGSGTIWFDNLHCVGNETTILQCQTKAAGDNDCTHSEDVGIICTDGKRFTFTCNL